jgi:hypothetical protein
LYDNGEQFYATNGVADKDISVYLDEFRLNGLPNNGFMLGNVQD